MVGAFIVEIQPFNGRREIAGAGVTLKIGDIGIDRFQLQQVGKTIAELAIGHDGHVIQLQLLHS